MRKDIYEAKDLIVQWVKDSKPKRQICMLLNCRPATLDRILKKIKYRL